MDTEAEQSKAGRKRWRGSNCKAGCNTCKTRRIKCDETKPICLRCIRSDRECDYPSLVTQSRPVQSQSAFSPNRTLVRPIHSKPQLAPEEMAHFDYFRLICSQEWRGSFNGATWTSEMLKATQSEVFIRDAILAIGAFRRYQAHPPPFPSNWIQSRNTQYCVKKYVSASGTLRRMIQSGTADWRLALLGSFALMYFEVVQGNELGLFMHIRGASAIWKSMYRPNADLSSSHSSNMIAKGYTWNIPNNEITNLESSMSGDCMETITPCTRLSIDDSRISDLQGTSATRFPSPHLQTPSELFFKARDSLINIIVNMESFFRMRGQIHHSLLGVALPPIFAKELSEIQTDLQNWLQNSKLFFPAAWDITAEVEIAGVKDMVKARYLMTWIRLSTFFYSEQTVYDQYLPQFQQIVDLLSSVIGMGNGLASKIKEQTLVVNLAITRMLYFVVWRCRDPLARGQAIKNMQRAGKENIYTGRILPKIAEWILYKEEDGLCQGSCVGEEKRFHDVRFDFDCVTGITKVKATRRGFDGPWEQLCEDLNVS